MTTIMAVVAAVIFFNRSMWWVFILVVLIGASQTFTKWAMNVYVKVNKDSMPLAEAVNSIPNSLTLANMLCSFAVWGLTAYALVLKFL